MEDIKRHPFFRGIDWENLYSCPAPYIPEVGGELDSSNFEKFEDAPEFDPTDKGGDRAERPWAQVSKDPNFVGYTYKNFEVVNNAVRKKQAAGRTPLSAVVFQQAGAAGGAGGAEGGSPQ